MRETKVYLSRATDTYILIPGNLPHEFISIDSRDEENISLKDKKTFYFDLKLHVV